MCYCTQGKGILSLTGIYRVSIVFVSVFLNLSKHPGPLRIILKQCLTTVKHLALRHRTVLNSVLQIVEFVADCLKTSSTT